MAIHAKIQIECQDKEELVAHLHKIIHQVIDTPDVRFEHNDPITIDDVAHYGRHAVLIQPD